jgi:putative flippase GtrA
MIEKAKDVGQIAGAKVLMSMAVGLLRKAADIQLVRYGISGSINTVVYVASGKAMILSGMNAHATGALALALAMCAGFLLHRAFSFRSSNVAGHDARRFLCLGAVNASISTFGLPALMSTGQISPLMSLLLLGCLLPLTNFVAMKFWVFSERAPVPDGGEKSAFRSPVTKPGSLPDNLSA